ncbi:FecCD family ABC transporter permease [Methanococcus voltae]|uniref:Iron complex transport system permease protein n=2 Tax=Methanococcus voltae TaxID=2188 RepID=A0A8J7RHV3_METVO|nr:iron ABC transporter permease [Methanococcus voltae]MBP2171869.1 iron complex transport system permease protein [Methanococcus voltae]MBP2201176.1 iron complex transport system permease protein [Methanococcus voltae]MCS3921899.1 iron complex transport system permease protein [Methanococcus voltae PS]
MDKKYIFLMLAFLGLLFVLSIFSLTVGTSNIPFYQILQYLLTGTTGTELTDTILFKIRILRTLGAIVAGFGISTAGILMQSYFRNPLADPYLMGVSNGATLGVVLYGFTSVLLWSNLPKSSMGMILSAYVGSIIVMSVISTIAKFSRQTSTLLISGIMIGAITSGITTMLIYTGDMLGDDNSKLSHFFSWGMGSVSNLTVDYLIIMAVIVIPLIFLILILLSKKLDANILGDNYAKSVGLNVKSFKRVLISLSCMLTATIVAFTGPIAFIGMFTPIISKIICGTSKHSKIIPMSASLGAIFLLIADIIARPSVIIPHGTSTLPLLCPLSIMGAPIAIYVYTKSKQFRM